jgi:hypothetical protein
MIVTYLRSSSFNTHINCEQQYFIEYVLGWRGKSNIKADKGSIVHKILEILAMIKFAKQNKEQSIKDDIVGEVSIKKYDLDQIINIVYDYYSTANPHHNWSDKDRNDCKDWTYKTIQFNNGMFDPRNRTIVCPEQQFDFEIKKPWAKYEYDTPEGKLSGYLAMKGTIDLITKIDDNFYEIIDWKGLPVDTLLPTPDGWTTMGEIQVGDKTFDQYGHECEIIGKSRVKTKSCYRITFDDTTSVVCDDEHLWKLSNGETVPVTELCNGDTINVSKPLICKEIDLPIEPYLLGVWLGDGRNRSCEISSNDTEIFEELIRRDHLLGTIKNDTRSSVKYVTILDSTNKLRNLNLLNNKHIPEIYFRASFQQRLDLLRGLMDTDGNVNSIRKQAVFTSCNKKLSDDVKSLLLTLGQRPNQSDITRDTNFKNNIKIYPVCFRPININPFLLSRKANRIDPNWGAGRSNIRRITSIHRSIIQKTQCISVNSPDNTYLCTENLIPTHNTGKRKNWTTGEEKTQEKLEKDPQLMIYYYAAQHLYANVENIMLTINFINDGGPFSICFGKKDIKETERMLRDRFEKIKETTKPKLNKTWMCNRLCHFGKNSFDTEGIHAITEYRNGQVVPIDKPMTMCEQIKHDIDIKGMDAVVEEYTKPNFTVGHYKAPGSTE